MTTADLLKDVDLDKCLTLGDYKGIELENIDTTVSDEEIEEEIAYALSMYPTEVTGRPVQEGDTVTIDYVGRIDGEEFEGGTAEGTDLKIGSGQFIDGFESGLVGASTGETRVLDLTFPEEYTEELAGKDVEFTVTVVKIKESQTEATDEWVAANIEGYYTVEEYREGLRSELQETNEQSAQSQLRYNAWNAVVEACTIHEYPEALVELGAELYSQEAETYASYMGMELEDYVESCGLTMEEYEEYKTEYGKSIAAQAMVAQAICDKEGYKIGDDKYQEELAALLEDYQCTEEELISSYGRDSVEQTILLNHVCDLILENAVITEPESSEAAE